MYVSAILSDSQIEAGYSVDANAGVGARSVSVTTSGGTSGGLTFNVTAPGGGGCGYERDTLIQEYATYNVNLTPECAWFTQSASSQYFTFSELHVNDFYSWALIRQPLVVNKSSGYGLDRWRELYGGPRTVNSGYRSPSKNASIAGAAQSRHMYGDAVDLANASHTRQEYDDMANAAKYGNPNAGASWVEDWSGPCGDGCVHADWRNAAGGYSQ